MENIIIENEKQLLKNTLGKTEINALVAEVVSEVKEGYRNPLETVIKLKAISKAADNICNEIMGTAVDEANKYAKGEKAYGAKIDVRETGVKYDFSKSQTWRDLIIKKQEIEEQIKAIETAMKNASEYSPYVDILTGEVITTPAPRQSKTIVAVTF